jgi:acetylornithine deacetylase/succinyl-diaminopimelate desuccinylase-like protein
MIEDLGAERAELAKFDKGFPVVFGRISSKRPNAKTLICYSLYDVMPIEDNEDWKGDPFGASLVDATTIDLPAHYGKCILARGANNQKGPIMGLINALQTLLAVDGDLPCNVVFTFEGEEEMGSTNFTTEFRARYMDELRGADGAIYLNPSQTETDDVMIHLGTRGIVFGEMTLEGGDWGGPTRGHQGARDDNWVDAPAWRLLKAVSTMKDDTGRVVVDGFWDDVEEWSEEDRTLIATLIDRLDEEAVKHQLGVKRLKGGASARELLPHFVMDPVLNIDGYSAGYTGPFTKTQLPDRAVIKFDLRLVPGQDFRKVLGCLRRHLDSHGFPEVEIKVIGGYNYSKSRPDEAIVRSATRATRACGFHPELWPIYYGGVPLSVFNAEPLNIPVVSGGPGRKGRDHMANEYFAVEGLRDYEKWLVTFLYDFAES